MYESHHNEPEEIDESILQFKKYWFEPQKLEFSTKVKEIDKTWIRLSENYFYPEGGGQPPDLGIITQTDKDYQVVDVQERDEEVWIEIKNNGIDLGDIDARIDANRRNQLSRNHSAQHLLSAVFWEELGFETTRALIGLDETEIEFDKKPSFEDIAKMTSVAETMIEQNFPIHSKLFKRDAIDDSVLRGDMVDLHNTLRIVEIEGYDFNACGGTHVSNTLEIQTLAVHKVDRKKIKFITAQDARQFQEKLNIQIFESSRVLGTPVTSVLESLRGLKQQKEKIEREANKLRSSLVEAQLQLLDWKSSANVDYFVIETSFVNRGIVLSALGELEENQLGLVYSGGGMFLLLGGNQSLVQDMMNILRKSGIKGGGDRVVMGKTNDTDQLVELFESSLLELGKS